MLVAILGTIMGEGAMETLSSSNYVNVILLDHALLHQASTAILPLTNMHTRFSIVNNLFWADWLDRVALHGTVASLEWRVKWSRGEDS
jgi:hypothetical protein